MHTPIDMFVPILSDYFDFDGNDDGTSISIRLEIVESNFPFSEI